MPTQSEFDSLTSDKARLQMRIGELEAEVAQFKELAETQAKSAEDGWNRTRALAADRDQISLTLAVAKADRDKWFNRARDLEKALTMLYDKWENGDGCYEDPETCGGFLGNAFKLSQEEENLVMGLIGTTVAAAPDEIDDLFDRSGWPEASAPETGVKDG